MATTDVQAVDEGKLEQVLGQLVTDMGAAMNGVLVLMGVELGLWRALDNAGPLTADALAERAGMRERYVREWLSAQAASGYLTYDAATGAFTLPPEQAMAFAREDSPVYLAGGYRLISSVFKDRQKITERIRGGEGFGWHEHDPELFAGTEQFFRPGYRANLVGEWLPALDGVVDKLSAGAKVADIGCGHGVSTTLIAQAFPTHVRASGTGFAIGVGRGGSVLAPIIAGFLFTVLLFHLKDQPILTTLWAFPVTRIIDIIKIPPARRLEHLPRGYGVLADDLLGSVYAALCLWVLKFTIPGWFSWPS